MRGPRAKFMQIVRAPQNVRHGPIPEETETEVWSRASEGVAVLADKIWDKLQDLPYVDVASMGATATNNAAKAIAEVRRARLTDAEDVDLLCQPYFASFVERETNEERTRIVFRVFLKGMGS